MLVQALLTKRCGKQIGIIDVPEDVFVVSYGGSYFVHRDTTFKTAGLIGFVETDMLVTNRAAKPVS